MKKCSSSGARDRHYVGVRSWLIASPKDQVGIDSDIFASLQYPVARFILTDDAGTGQRKGGAQVGQINEDNARRTARPAVFRKNVRQCVLIWPDIDDLDVVDDPVAGAENSFAVAHLLW